MAKRERREPVGVTRINANGEIEFIYSLSKDAIHDMYKRMDAGPKIIASSKSRPGTSQEKPSQE
jgi:hypothetical protein